MHEHDKIIIRDLELQMSIGIHEYEKKEPQRVLVNIVLEVISNRDKKLNSIDDVVSYEEVLKKIESSTTNSHFDLVEQLAETIAQTCLSYDHKICGASIKVEKPDIISNTAAVGIHIYRNSQ
ncbi:MAG: dihydroneopterin aldolase [Alphaproteobacteria bacterium]